MVITPQTDIRLLKCPLLADNKNQLTFSTKQAQTNYFMSLPHIIEDNCTYQRKDGVIRFPAHIDDIINFNYVMYQNEAYSSKWFYAYITNMQYVNDNVTNIFISTDCFQTWQFDITYLQSFVEREHVNNDTIGSNIVEEGLHVPEYIYTKAPEELLNNIDDFLICMGVSEIPDESIPPNNTTRIMNGVFSGLYMIVGKTSNDVQQAIKIYDHFAKANAIYTIFMIPKTFAQLTFPR